jgi:hypothetical protein
VNGEGEFAVKITSEFQQDRNAYRESPKLSIKFPVISFLVLIKEIILCSLENMGYISCVAAATRRNPPGGPRPAKQEPPKMQTIPMSSIVDTGKVRLGAGCRHLTSILAPAAVPNVPPAAVADSGKVRLGAGCRR